MELEHIRATLAQYLSQFPEESERVQALAKALAQASTDAVISRDSPAHITVGAIACDRDRQMILQIHHRRLGRWLLPGGHVEPWDRSLSEAARRELEEETGELGRRARLVHDYPLDIDVHRIPSPTDSEKGEHSHFDLRFAFLVSDGNVELNEDESEAFRWVPASALGHVGERVQAVMRDD